MKIYLFSLLFLLTACMQDAKSPDGALQDFVEARIGKVVTRDFVLEKVTGKMLQSFENMSDEDFTKFADMRNIKRESFKILSKSCQDKKCFITYSVAYNTGDNDKKAFASEVKKIAEMNLVDGRWLIADVSNIKTYHEALEPINPLD